MLKIENNQNVSFGSSTRTAKKAVREAMSLTGQPGWVANIATGKLLERDGHDSFRRASTFVNLLTIATPKLAHDDIHTRQVGGALVNEVDERLRDRETPEVSNIFHRLWDNTRQCEIFNGNVWESAIKNERDKVEHHKPFEAYF